MRTNTSLFLLNIEADKVENISVNTVVTAALVTEDTTTGKVNIKIAKRMVLGKIIAKAKAGFPNVRPSGFVVDRNGKVKGNGLVALKPLLVGGAGVSYAVAEIRRYGKKEVIGYVLCDKNGKFGRLTKANVVECLTKNDDFVVNMKLVRDQKGQPFCALKDTNGVLSYIVGLEESKQNLKTAAKAAPAAKKMTVDEKKAEVLDKIKNSRLGSLLTPEYSIDCIEFLIELASARQKYDYLLNPKYDISQMQVLQIGYSEGVDISKYSDPKYDVKMMYDMLSVLRNGLWEECTFEFKA